MKSGVVSEGIARLSALPGATIDLDQIAVALGGRAATQEDIESIFDGLEAAGKRVEDTPNPERIAGAVAIVKRSVALAKELGRPPSLVETAAAADVTKDEALFAILFVISLNKRPNR